MYCGNMAAGIRIRIGPLIRKADGQLESIIALNRLAMEAFRREQEGLIMNQSEYNRLLKNAERN